MTRVRTIAVAGSEGGVRLDRWFRRHFPALGHGQLEKLLRTGQVRVDGKRAKSGLRLATGQMVRVPPLPEPTIPRISTRSVVTRTDAETLRQRVILIDDDVIALDKPPGLAVQGGTRVGRHLDAMLDALRFGAAERPRLVHRLDKDTSGVLLLGRNAAAAARLAAAFRHRTARKVYWAIVIGVPSPRRGRIDLPLGRQAGPRGERAGPDAAEGRRATTHYAVIDAAGREAAWLALMPITGRTHQLRAHLTAIGNPVLGDGKFGGRIAFLPTVPAARRLHLHAREVRIPHPRGGEFRVEATLPAHMAETWRFFGFEIERRFDPFRETEH